jgi:hypothetical protein
LLAATLNKVLKGRIGKSHQAFSDYSMRDDLASRPGRFFYGSRLAAYGGESGVPQRKEALLSKWNQPLVPIDYPSPPQVGHSPPHRPDHRQQPQATQPGHPQPGLQQARKGGPWRDRRVCPTRVARQGWKFWARKRSPIRQFTWTHSDGRNGCVNNYAT